MFPDPKRVARRWLQARRPIPINKRLLQGKATYIWNRLWASTLSRMDPDSPIGVRRPFYISQVEVTTVRGEDRTVPIFMSFGRGGRGGRWMSLTDGGWNPKTEQLVIRLEQNKTPAWLKANEKHVIKSLYSTLIHEVTHAVDVIGDAPPVQSEQDYEGYINQPHEIRAFMQQIVDEALASADKAAQQLGGDMATPQRLVPHALNESVRWSTLKRQLNPKARRMIMQAVHTAIVEADFPNKYKDDWEDDWKPVMPFPDRERW